MPCARRSRRSQDGHPSREERYQKIDKLEEEMVKEIEKELLEILPEAFAVVKETARRFKENKECACGNGHGP
jgi:preprotein translocase subunit SecA